jgi:O-antigen/teichoic acid export membrane protein
MTPKDYGIMDLLDLALTVTSLFFGMRLGEAMLYYYFNEETESDRHLVVTTTFLASAFSGFLILCLGWIVAPQVSRVLLGDVRYAGYVRLMFVNLGGSFMFETGLIYLRGRNEAGRVVLVSVVRLASTISLILVLMIGYGMTVAAFLWASIVTAAVLSVYLYLDVLRELPLRFDWGLLWREIKYSYPLAFQGVAMLLINFGDRFFLRRVVSLDEIGLYAIAYKLGFIIDTAHWPFDLYGRSQAFHLLKTDNAHELYVQTCTYVFLALGTLMTGLVVFLSPALTLLVGPKFRVAAPYVPWIGLAYLIRAMADYFRTVMRTENQTRHEGTVASVSAAVCLVAYVTLIPAFHVWGAVAATVLAFAAMAVTSYWLGQKVKRHEFEWGRMAKIAVAATVVSVASRLISTSGLWNELVVSSVLMVLYFVILAGIGFATADEKRLIRQSAGVILRKVQAYRAA